MPVGIYSEGLRPGEHLQTEKIQKGKHQKENREKYKKEVKTLPIKAKVYTMAVGGNIVMFNKEDKREKGFKDVDTLLVGTDKDTVIRYCKENRLIPNEWYNSVDEVLDGKRRIPLLIKETGYSGRDNEYFLYKIGIKRDIILMEGEIDETTAYMIAKDREYQKATNIRRRDKKGYEGKFTGGFIPYGYYLKDKKLLMDDYESFIVKFVFYRYSQGCSMCGITKELNLRKFKNRNGNPFAVCSIENILENKRFYQGYTRYKGREVKGDYIGILEDSETLLTEEWKNRVFDCATEARISRHRERYHSENSVPNEIKPYILVGTERGKKVRRDV